MSSNPTILTMDELIMLVDAAKHDEVEIIKRFSRDQLDMVKHRCNDHLLHIVIFKRATKVFEYLLSLPDYPIDNVNAFGETPLEIAILRNNFVFVSVLLERGANPRHVNPRTKKSLVDEPFKGLIAAFGRTRKQKKYEELIHCLLCWGADLSSKYGDFFYFQLAVKYGSPFLAQTMFLHCFDEHTTCPEMSVGVLILLAYRRSWYFYRVLKASKRIVYVLGDENYTKFLFLMQGNYLDALMPKCGTFLEGLLAYHQPAVRLCDEFAYTPLDDFLVQTPLKQLDVMFKSKLSKGLSNCVKVATGTWLLKEVSDRSRRSETERFLCFLMSYGMNVEEQLLHRVYGRYGLCELFRVMIHMDVIKSPRMKSRLFIPSLICDIHVDLDYVVKFFSTYSDAMKNVVDLLSFSALPKLKHRISRAPVGDTDAVLEKIRSLPDVPALQELTRNKIKKHFIEKHNIQTTKEYYAFIHKLPVHSLCKDIILFLHPLY